jgi:hypothetical protein
MLRGYKCKKRSSEPAGGTFALLFAANLRE